MYDILELKKQKLQDLQEIATNLEISGVKNLKKLDLIYEILDKQSENPDKNESTNKTSRTRPKKTQRSEIKKSHHSKNNNIKEIRFPKTKPLIIKYTPFIKNIFLMLVLLAPKTFKPQ